MNRVEQTGSIKSHMDFVLSRFKDKEDGYLRVQTGYSDLDEATHGLHASELIILAGRPAIGKTSFCLDIVRHAATKNGLGAAVFLFGDSSARAARILLAEESKVDIDHIEKGWVSEEEYERIKDASQILKNTNMFIDDDEWIDMPLEDLYINCWKYADSKGVDFIVIDSLQHIVLKKETPQKERYVEIVRSLKRLAVELQVPILLVSNLPASADDNPDLSPPIEALREYGAIDQYADMIIFISREEYYNPQTEKKRIAEIKIAKQKHGDNRTIELAWTPRRMKFSNLIRE